MSKWEGMDYDDPKQVTAFLRETQRVFFRRCHVTPGQEDTVASEALFRAWLLISKVRPNDPFTYCWAYLWRTVRRYTKASKYQVGYHDPLVQLFEDGSEEPHPEAADHDDPLSILLAREAVAQRLAATPTVEPDDAKRALWAARKREQRAQNARRALLRGGPPKQRGVPARRVQVTTGDSVQVFDSITEASRCMTASLQGVVYACNHGTNLKGSQWQWA
jgi:hypothetical protein